MVAAGQNDWGGPRKSESAASFDIAEISTVTGGRIGLAPLPGMREGRYRADLLDHDLDRVAEWGATALLCLMEPDEIAGLDLDRLSFGLRRREIGFVHLPIADDGVPDAQFDDAWAQLRRRLVGALGHGKRLMTQCANGRGRCGMAAVRLLIDTGSDVEDAIAMLRRARPNALSRDEEVESVRAYALRR